MTEELGQDLSIGPLESLIGFHVSDTWIGEGTFLIIDLGDAGSSHTASLWVYFADWAVLVDNRETVASDTLAEHREGRLRVDALIGRHLSDVDKLDNEELHLDFSDATRLEIWENRDAYGVGADLLQIFRDGEHTATLRFVIPSVH